MRATLCIGATIVALAASSPAGAGQPFRIEIAATTRAYALIRDTVVAQIHLLQALEAADRFSRQSGPGIPVL
jgi:hypothetical protein